MVARTLWLWLSVWWLITWLTEALMDQGSSTSNSICAREPCSCTRGHLICDCSSSKIKEVVLKDLMEQSPISFVNIAGCSTVHVPSNALVSLSGLQQVSFTNISRLTLEEHSLTWATEQSTHGGLLVNIFNCNLPEIPSYTFKGSLREIVLSSVNISNVRPFAFGAMDLLENLEFRRVNFSEVDPQSFKKFSANRLVVSDSSFATLPTRTMVDVEVHHEVKFDNVVIDSVKSSGLKIHGPKEFKFVKSVIGHMESHAFHIHTRGPVSVMDNVFPHVENGAFAGITLEKRFKQEFGNQDLLFENNTLTNFENAALTFNTEGFRLKMDKISLQQPCSCDNALYWSAELVYFTSSTNRLAAVPHVSTVLYCLKDLTSMNVKEFKKRFCISQESNILSTLALITVSVFSLSTAVMLVVYWVLKRRSKLYINVPTSASPLKQMPVLVIPEGKTYRETQVDIIVERVEPIVPIEYVSAPAAADG